MWEYDLEAFLSSQVLEIQGPEISLLASVVEEKKEKVIVEGHRYFTTGTVEGKSIIILGLTFLEPSHTSVIPDSPS